MALPRVDVEADVLPSSSMYWIGADRGIDRGDHHAFAHQRAAGAEAWGLALVLRLAAEPQTRKQGRRGPSRRAKTSILGHV